MHLAIIIAGIGGVLIHCTWTMLVLAVMMLELTACACQEERALVAEFGVTWETHCRRVRHIARLIDAK